MNPLPVITVFFVCLGLTQARVELTQFIPFGESVNDTNLATVLVGGLDDGSSRQIKLGNQFQFFANLYNSLYVNINGGVSFNGAISTYTPTCAPLSQAMSMIAPFWADVVLWTPPGKAFFRETTDVGVLNRLLADVKQAFPQMHDVTQMKWAFIVTWHKVAFFGERNRPNNASMTAEGDILNTFQMAMVTDNIYSFVIFNYNDLQWTTGTASGGNSRGLGGTPARAGFDDGQGKLTKLPESCTPDILKVVNETNIPNGGQLGKFVFRVDSDQVVIPGTATLPTVTDSGITRFTIPTQTRVTVQPPLTTVSEVEVEFRKHFTRTDEHMRTIRSRLLIDCDKLIERPALEKECYHELEKLNNLFHELKLTKYMDELERVDREVEKIALVIDRLERDISYYY